MSAAGIGAAAAVAGAGLGIIGTITGNNAQAAAEEANAAYYKEQQEFARQSMIRDLKIYSEDAEEVFGAQVTGAAAGGVNLEGSPLLVLASTRKRQIEEQDAIKAGGKANIREAYLRAGASMANASRLGSFEANVLPAFGSALGAAGQVATAFHDYRGDSPTDPGNYRSSYTNSARASYRYGGR